MLPKRKLMFCSECAVWRRLWSKAHARREFERNLWPAPEEAGEWLAREARDGDVVLLKASRGVKLEKALETWKASRGAHGSEG